MSDTHQEFSPTLDVPRETLQPFDVREREGVSPMIKLALLAGALLLAAFIVLKIYTPGVRDRSDPPVIERDNTPFKVKPEDVGGTQTPNQDKDIFDVMDGQSPDTIVTPDPRPEKPIIQAPKPVTPRPAPKAKPVKRPAVERPPVSRPAQSGSTSAITAAGNSEWVVQVASTRSQVDANNVWASVKRKYPSLVAGKYADIRRVDLGDKGIYFRTRLAGLPDKAAAQSLCASLKAAGQACLVAKR